MSIHAIGRYKNTVEDKTRDARTFKVHRSVAAWTALYAAAILRRTKTKTTHDRKPRRAHRPGGPARNRTPSPSATAMICARLDFARTAMAFRRMDKGRPDRGEGTGGSTIS